MNWKGLIASGVFIIIVIALVFRVKPIKKIVTGMDDAPVAS